MKRLILGILLLSSGFVSCVNNKVPDNKSTETIEEVDYIKQTGTYFYTTKIGDHLYIVADKIGSGICILHSPECKSDSIK